MADDEFGSVEKITGIRTVAGRTEYRVKWEGDDELTWVDEEDVQDIDYLVEQYRSEERAAAKKPKKAPQPPPPPVTTRKRIGRPPKNAGVAKQSASRRVVDSDEGSEDELSEDDAGAEYEEAEDDDDDDDVDEIDQDEYSPHPRPEASHSKRSARSKPVAPTRQSSRRTARKDNYEPEEASERVDFVDGPAPTKIVSKSVAQSGRVVYTVKWSDGTTTQEPLQSNCSENWLDMMEEFEHKDGDSDESEDAKPVANRFQNKEAPKRGRKRKNVIESSSDAEDWKATQKRKVEAKGVSEHSHHKICCKCGMTPDSRRRGRHDATVGALGECDACVTCSSICHMSCFKKSIGRARVREETARASSAYDVQGFQCERCVSVIMPHCSICDKPPAIDGAPQQKVDVATTEGASKPRTLATSENTTPVVRCIRCSFVGHVDCLVAEYEALYPDYREVDDANGLEFGTFEHYMTNFLCNDCITWDHDIESILCRRDAEPGRVLNRKVQHSGRAHEFCVKFIGLSYRDFAWVPEQWLSAVPGGGSKLRKWLRYFDNPNEPMPSIDTALREDWLRVDKILDIEFDKGYNQILLQKGRDQNSIQPNQVEQRLIPFISNVLVKWKSLPYTAVTWENIPGSEAADEQGLQISKKDQDFKAKIETDMRPSFVEGLKRYVARYRVGDDSIASLRAPKFVKPHFVEMTEQPDYVTGGRLKGYQMDGLNWLLFKWTKGVPCILADEMGLGKTVQIVSFINTLFKSHHLFPFLIVVPIITLGHWLKEFEFWAPDIVVIHYGGEKADREAILKHLVYCDEMQTSGVGGLGGFKPVKFHVLLAGYEILMAESSLFKHIPFKVLICDEGHRLKNEQSKTFESFVANINTGHKIIMTGTPLQNNLRELFSLLSFLDPVVWEDPRKLELEYENINDSKILQIHEDLKPYFLRRTKGQVLEFELPPKAEILVPCALTGLQKQLYKAVLSRNFKILKQIGEKTGEGRVSPLHNILMELRKICDHPYLLPDVEPQNLTADQIHQYLVNASGKLILLQPLLARLKQRGHRVLIFSQFKIALNILEDFLHGEGHMYMRIDGDTPVGNRQGLLDSYNAPNSPYFAFLLTTRAGGVGINLTSADTIVMYDADWNPHQGSGFAEIIDPLIYLISFADIQAMARVHRIGQKRPVLIFKLFSRGAVEERIIEMGKKKLVLDHLIVEKMVDSNVDTRELSEIIKFGAQNLFEEGVEEAPVKYDDSEIERLLHRDELIAQQKRSEEMDKEGEKGDSVKNSFAFARVWTLEKEQDVPSGNRVKTILAEAKRDEELGLNKPSDSAVTHQAGAENAVVDEEAAKDPEFWDKLLKERIEEAAREEERQRMRDRGKRRRNEINYYQSQNQNQSKRKRRGGEEDDQGATSDIERDIDSDYEDDGSGADDPNQDPEVADDGDFGGERAASSLLKKKAEKVYPSVPSFLRLPPPQANTAFLLPASQESAHKRTQSSVNCFLCNSKICRYKSQCVKTLDSGPASLAALQKMLKDNINLERREADSNIGIGNSRVKVLKVLIERLENQLRARNAMPVQSITIEKNDSSKQRAGAVIGGDGHSAAALTHLNRMPDLRLSVFEMISQITSIRAATGMSSNLITAGDGNGGLGPGSGGAGSGAGPGPGFGNDGGAGPSPGSGTEGGGSANGDRLSSLTNGQSQANTQSVTVV